MTWENVQILQNIPKEGKEDNIFHMPTTVLSVFQALFFSGTALEMI